jgi:hypothetical protein
MNIDRNHDYSNGIIVPSNNNPVLIHKNSYNNFFYNNVPNVIVFDMDETLGSFIDLDILWKYLKNKMDFNKLLDIYPEFLRYGILCILNFIYKKKIKGKCDKIFIYTNNKCLYDFVDLISNYFSYKLGILKNDPILFDQIIRSFKINNKIIEINRTTRYKTYNDFIRCTSLPKNTRICFIDNNYFSFMKNSYVYYIQPLSYHHHLSKEQIIYRILNLGLEESVIQTIYNKLYTFNNTQIYKYYDYIHNKKNIDIFVYHKLIYHIKYFLYITRKHNKTKKKYKFISRFTRKNKEEFIPVKT